MCMQATSLVIYVRPALSIIKGGDLLTRWSVRQWLCGRRDTFAPVPYPPSRALMAFDEKCRQRWKKDSTGCRTTSMTWIRVVTKTCCGWVCIRCDWWIVFKIEKIESRWFKTLPLLNVVMGGVNKQTNGVHERQVENERETLRQKISSCRRAWGAKINN